MWSILSVGRFFGLGVAEAEDLRGLLHHPKPSPTTCE